MPTVNTKKNVPMNSTPSLRSMAITNSLPRAVRERRAVATGGLQRRCNDPATILAMVGSGVAADT
jgi:hypothetical protein